MKYWYGIVDTYLYILFLNYSCSMGGQTLVYNTLLLPSRQEIRFNNLKLHQHLFDKRKRSPNIDITPRRNRFLVEIFYFELYFNLSSKTKFCTTRGHIERIMLN